MISVSDQLQFDPDPRIHFLKSEKIEQIPLFFCKKYKTHNLIRINVPWSGTGSGQMIRIRQDPSPLRRGGGQNPCKLKKMQVFLCGGKKCLTFSEISRFKKLIFVYHPFHNTLPRSSAFVKWISVRFYEADCSTSNVLKISQKMYTNIRLLMRELKITLVFRVKSS